MTAHDVDADFSGSEPENEFEIRRDPWIKRVLPRTMFGRSLLVIPLILLQAIATWVFYDRHWAAISWRLSAAVAGDIGLLIDALKLADSPAQAARLLERAKAQNDLDVTVRRAAALPPALPMTGRLIEDQLNQAILGRVDLPFRIDLAEDGGAEIKVQLADGVMSVNVPRNRLSSSTTYIFVMWMLGSSLVLLAVATVFLRNQVKSLRRLAEAADSFGKGLPVPSLKVEGAVEIRRAAIAFMTMRDRLQRQVRPRTQMLAEDPACASPRVHVRPSHAPWISSSPTVSGRSTAMRTGRPKRSASDAARSACR